ncbi:MAG: 50S ribosomal protein L11 methyltransferase, partial [Verrucomicrobiia bacterium]
VIPAGMAFGTGQHATTAMCLRRLAEMIRPGSKGSMLDVGTGSGVLALAAARWGWRSEGMDYDPEAIREARRNGRRNGLGGEVRFRVAAVEEFEPEEPVDLVVANLFASMLERSLARMRGWVKGGGGMILSGILVDQEEGVRRAAEEVGIRIRRRWRLGKWVCLAGRCS